jgi:hypothetical protein
LVPATAAGSVSSCTTGGDEDQREDRHREDHDEAIAPPQSRVQDRHPIAQPPGLLQPVRRQEDRHPALAKRGDQLVDLARRDRIQPGRGLVEEQHRRIVEQRAGERDALAQALRQRPARISMRSSRLTARSARSMRPRTSSSS